MLRLYFLALRFRLLLEMTVELDEIVPAIGEQNCNQAGHDFLALGLR